MTELEQRVEDAMDEVFRLTPLLLKGATGKSYSVSSMQR